MRDLTNRWMQTFTGRRFYPLAPEPADVVPVDVAHALSLICRYGGHTTRHYSVAEHTVLVSRWVEDNGGTQDEALWGLLHDATEAYVGDMIRPLKHGPGMEAYVAAEDQVMACVALRFGLMTEWQSLDDAEPGQVYLAPLMPAIVKEADNRIILDERLAVMRPTTERWAAEDLEPLGVPVVGWEPRVAESEWLIRLADLWSGDLSAGGPLR